jgi:hypothetical protein
LPLRSCSFQELQKRTKLQQKQLKAFGVSFFISFHSKILPQLSIKLNGGGGGS